MDNGEWRPADDNYGVGKCLDCRGMIYRKSIHSENYAAVWLHALKVCAVLYSTYRNCQNKCPVILASKVPDENIYGLFNGLK